MRLDNHKQLVADGVIEGLKLKITVGNPEFVRLITIVKYANFFLSLLCCYLFYKQMKHVPINLRVVEQSLIMRQSVLLVLFNDPLFAMIFYRPNGLQ
jgi:Wnt-binding factor required for Wnt secretion